MTIMEAVLTVLRAADKPMTAADIYDKICKDRLFEFSAKDPLAILKAQLRRNALGFSGKTANTKPSLKQLPDKKYAPL